MHGRFTNPYARQDGELSVRYLLPYLLRTSKVNAEAEEKLHVT